MVYHTFMLITVVIVIILFVVILITRTVILLRDRLTRRPLLLMRVKQPEVRDRRQQAPGKCNYNVCGFRGLGFWDFRA